MSNVYKKRAPMARRRLTPARIKLHFSDLSNADVVESVEFNSPQVAKALGLTRDALYCHLTTYHNTCVSRLRLEWRKEQIEQRLKCGEESKYIAERLGFDAESTLYSFIRREYGCSITLLRHRCVMESQEQ